MSARAQSAPRVDPERALRMARQTFEIEAGAIRGLADRLADSFAQAAGVPWIVPEAPMIEAMREMSRTGFGATAIVAEGMHLAGIFTDGDLRRLVERGADLRSVLNSNDLMRAKVI